jgi:hypothetical protein
MFKFSDEDSDLRNLNFGLGVVDTHTYPTSYFNNYIYF